MRAGADLSAFPRREIEIRGRRQIVAVRTLVRGRDLPELATARAALPA
jgi:hypothetical protein